MSSKGRAGIALVVAALVAASIAAFVLIQEEREDALRPEASPVVDASVDGRAKVAKGKPAGKKKTGRGGKTHVAPRATAAKGGGATHGHHASPSGPSYESALDSNDQQIEIGAKTGPDLTDAQLSAPMSDGTFISECGAPDSMGVTVKVAIRLGRAHGVSVSTNPPAPDVAGCIDRHVRALSWPVSAKMDSFVTAY